MNIEDAVDKALNEMPDDFEIKGFLMDNKAEVKNMLLTEYNEAENLNAFKEEGREEGSQETGDLLNFLWTNGRGDEAKRAMTDKDLYVRLLAEFRSLTS